jgi:hypothetical protein
MTAQPTFLRHIWALTENPILLLVRQSILSRIEVHTLFNFLDAMECYAMNYLGRIWRVTQLKVNRSPICLILVWALFVPAASFAHRNPVQAQFAHEDLCRDLIKVHRIPFSDEPVEDKIYNKLAQAGPAVVPCLVNRISDTRKMRDPRSEPTFSDFRVGDLAFFILVKLHKVPFDTMLPPEVQGRLRDEGVYAYFKYVSNIQNRRALQKRVRDWIEVNSRHDLGTGG